MKLVQAIIGVFGTRAADEDPLADYPFLIEIPGFARAGFQKCSGIAIKFEQIKYREGGNAATPQKRPGQADFADITLERGIIISPGAGKLDVRNWLSQIFDVATNKPTRKKLFRRVIDVVTLDNEGNNAFRLRIKQAWITDAEVQGPLDALSNNNLIEKIVIAHEGWETIDPP